MKVKVCGLRRQEDVTACEDAGVDYAGFIFARSSPRYIDPSAAADMESGKMLRVGVFADQPLDEVLAAALEARLDYVQLHGRESPEYAREAGAERVIKVMWPEAAAGRCLEEEMAAYADVSVFFLLDAGRGGGGHGSGFSLSLISGICPPRPFFLAGGLGPGNIETVMDGFGKNGKNIPFALDLNSGLEISPGVKDAEKIKRAVRIIRGEERREMRPWER